MNKLDDIKLTEKETEKFLDKDGNFDSAKFKEHNKAFFEKENQKYAKNKESLDSKLEKLGLSKEEIALL